MPTLISAKKNMQSAMGHPDVVKDYPENEIWERRVIGQWTIPAAHIPIIFGGFQNFTSPYKW